MRLLQEDMMSGLVIAGIVVGAIVFIVVFSIAVGKFIKGPGSRNSK